MKQSKYLIINTQKIQGPLPTTPEELAAAILINPQCVEFGGIGSPEEFFVLKLKDQFTRPSLLTYSTAVRHCDPEYANQVRQLADRSGHLHPLCKIPD